MRAGPPRQSALWLWASVSAGVHIAIFLGFGTMGAGLFGGAGLRDGDGFGGTSVSFEIAGPEDALPEGGRSAGSMHTIPETLPEQQAASNPARAALQGELPIRAEETAEVSSPEMPGEEVRPRGAERSRSELQPLPARDIPHRDDPLQEAVTAAGTSESPTGTGADDSTAGAPAGDPSALILGSAGALGDSVAARRALLPNGGACSDPVAGVWRAQKYRGYDRTWVRFILRIRRSGDQLTGTITSRIWSGNPSNPQPGECTAFGFDHTWQMQARGSVDGTQVVFGSRTARLVEAHCPSSDARYAADNFTGTIEPLSETYPTTNNDGAFDIDEPYTFRRISCE
jgi:hypothetical protein